MKGTFNDYASSCLLPLAKCSTLDETGPQGESTPIRMPTHSERAADKQVAQGTSETAGAQRG